MQIFVCVSVLLSMSMTLYLSLPPSLSLCLCHSLSLSVCLSLSCFVLADKVLCVYSMPVLTLLCIWGYIWTLSYMSLVMGDRLQSYATTHSNCKNFLHFAKNEENDNLRNVGSILVFKNMNCIQQLKQLALGYFI